MQILRNIPPIVWVLATSVVVQLLTLHSGHDWGDDFALYILQARSLLESSIPELMAVTAFLHTHSSCIVGPLFYPWGVPVMLSPVYAAFGLNMLAFKLLYLGLFFLFLFSLYVFACSRMQGFALWAFVGFFALNNSYLDFAGQITSEIPFVLVSFLTLTVMGRVYVEQRPLMEKYADAVLVGLLCVVCATVRANGIFALCTLLCVFAVNVLQHRGSGDMAARLRLYAVPCVVFVLCYGLWLAYFPSGTGSYIDYMQELTPAVLLSNTLYNISALGDFFVIPGFPQAKYITLVLTLPLALWGVLRHFRRYYHFLLFAAATFALFTIWPFRHGARFFLPLFPLYLFFAFLGLDALMQYAQSHRPQWEIWIRRIGGGVMGIMLCVTLVTSVYRVLPGEKVWKQEGEYGPYSASAQDLFRYVRENTAKDSVMVFFKPRVMSLLTDRRAVLLETAADITEAHSGMYLIFFRWEDNGFGQMRFAEVQQLQQEGRLESIYANKEFEMFKLR